MSISPDFTDEEIQIVRDTVAERYGQTKQIELADVEVRLSKGDRELNERPALYWEDKDCHFVIVKLGPFQYHNQFFYRGHEQFGTGKDNYEDIHPCTVTLLQVQADHEVSLLDS